MKKLSAALLLYLGLASAALAQTKFTLPPPAGIFLGGYQVVTTCGAASGLAAGNLAFGAMDTTGAICTNVTGGGGGGAATIANGADVAEGSTTDAASTAGGTGTVSAKLRLMTTQLGTINTTLGSPFQAGGALAANQSVNTAQINGVTTLTGTGAAGTGSQRVTLSNTDPCMSPDIAKSSAAINITSATTTSLVAVSGSTVVYVCGISFSIAPSATTADSILFEYGTGATCTSPTVLTGTYGSGDLTTAAPLVIINYGGAGQTIFKSAASAGICALSAGNVVNIQGVLTYVQQ